MKTKHSNTIFQMKKPYHYNHQVQSAQNRIFAALNPFRFSSEYHDEDLDLIYYNYRHYNPTDGRWINRDPIEEQGGVNLYKYVENQVSYRTDRLGQEDDENEEEDPIVGYVYDEALEGADIFVEEGSRLVFENKALENDIEQLAKSAKAGSIANYKANSNMWTPKFNEKVSVVKSVSACRVKQLGVKLTPVANVLKLVGFSSKLEKVRFQELVRAFIDFQTTPDAGNCLKLFGSIQSYTESLPGGGDNFVTLGIYVSYVINCQKFY